MKEEFENLFEYNNHFNQKLITLIIEEKQKISEKTLKLINHIINAHQIWNARINNDAEFKVWQINIWEKLSIIDIDNYKKTSEIISQCNLENNVEYINSKRLVFSNKIKDVLFHIINHSTYHRGQIATELRISGIEPINTDYFLQKKPRLTLV